MTSLKHFSGLASTAILIAGSALVASDAAEARERTTRVQGARTGATINRQIQREPGHASATRSVQGDLGRGATTTRNSSWGEGSASTSSSTTFNNGQTLERQRSATVNGDGTADYSRSRTTARGTATVQGNVARTDEGVSHSKSVTTPSGESYTRDVDWTRTDSGVTREANYTNSQGQSASRSATVSVDGNGTAKKSVTATGPNGGEASTERWISVYPSNPR